MLAPEKRPRPTLRRQRRPVRFDFRDARPCVVSRLDLKGRASEKRHRVDNDERPGEVRMVRGQCHREHATEAVSDDDRPIEMLLADVIGKVASHRGDERCVDRRYAGESGERQHVTGEATNEVRDGCLQVSPDAASPGMRRIGRPVR